MPEFMDVHRGMKGITPEGLMEAHRADLEIQDQEAMECTFRMMNAETQLLYASDYPHWDFDLPSTIYDLPFLSETAKRNILGGNAIKLFNLKLPAQKMARVA